jgi:hypothetical protein
MEVQEKINYQDVIDLGFKRSDESDNIFFKQNGFDWFLVTRNLTKRIYLDWDCETHLVQMIRVDKEQTIKGRIYIKNLEEVERVIRFFVGDVPDEI